MKYLSSFYWRQKDGIPNRTSVLLQQGTCGRNSVLFACVCTDGHTAAGRASGYLTGQLSEWFYRWGMKNLSRGGEKKIREMQEGIAEAVCKIDQELLTNEKSRGVLCREAAADLAGIVCVEDNFVLFYRGAQRIYHINTKCLRPHLKCLTGEQERDIFCRTSHCGGTLNIKSGVIQPETGILLATESFCKGLEEKMLAECLSVSQLSTQSKLDKHIRELGAEAERAAKQEISDVAAVAAVAE